MAPASGSGVAAVRSLSGTEDELTCKTSGLRSEADSMSLKQNPSGMSTSSTKGMSSASTASLKCDTSSKSASLLKADDNTSVLVRRVAASCDDSDQLNSPTASRLRIYEATGAESLQGRYKISYDHKVGEGSFARVYRGLDLQDNRQCAIKVYKCSSEDEDIDDEAALENFMQSVKVINSLVAGVAAPDAAAVGDEKLLSKRAGGDSPTSGSMSPVSLNGKPLGKGRKKIEAKIEEAPANRRCSFKLESIHADAENTLEETKTDVKELVKHMDLKRCFVEVLSYSKDATGELGLDIDSEKLFMITELGEESLEDRILRHAADGKTFSKGDLRDVQWALVSIVCSLHASGHVHLDIKPNNIMRFGQTWKLIDFDGAVKTGTHILLDRALVTPWYMAPEIAACRRDKVVASRLMDVWSVGLCALEAVFMQPVLKVWYDDWQDGDDSSKFFDWLADYETDPIMGGDMAKAMEDIDADMCSLLQGMLAKNPEDRLCIAECLVHPWFTPIRSSLWKGIAAEAVQPAETQSRSLGRRSFRSGNANTSEHAKLSKGRRSSHDSEKSAGCEVRSGGSDGRDGRYSKASRTCNVM